MKLLFPSSFQQTIKYQGLKDPLSSSAKAMASIFVLTKMKILFLSYSRYLSKVDVNELERNHKVGFRAKYIVESSKMIADKEVDLDAIYSLPTEKAQEELVKLPGVGPKVSSCILCLPLKKAMLSQ